MKQRKFLPEQVLKFCTKSNETDDTDSLEVSVEIKKNGISLQLNEKQKELVINFKEKIRREILKNADVAFEE